MFKLKKEDHEAVKMWLDLMQDTYTLYKNVEQWIIDVLLDENAQLEIPERLHKYPWEIIIDFLSRSTLKSKELTDKMHFYNLLLAIDFVFAVCEIYYSDKRLDDKRLDITRLFNTYYQVLENLRTYLKPFKKEE